VHIPAATVAPASLTANLDVNGFSLLVSRQRFPCGFIFTFAVSPFLRKSGCSFMTSPERGSICATNSVNWHGTWAV